MAEREGPGIARSAQHAVYVLPHTPYAIERVLAPALERLAPDAESTQLLILTADPETALAISDAARAISDRSSSPVVPITATARGIRLLSSRGVPAIAATPGTVVSLIRAAVLKLETVKSVVVAWADEIFVAHQNEPLEVILAEVPKEAGRVLVTDQMTAQVEALVEHHLRRARRTDVGVEEEETPALALRYVTTLGAERRSALRRLLDELDPPSVVVLVHDERGADDVRRTLAALGYEGDRSVRVATEPPEEPTSLVVLYDLPASRGEMAKVAAADAVHVVALVSPRQVPALRRLTAGAVEPLEVSPVAAKARSREERARAAIRAELEAGFPAREVIALEPLLREFDGLEIAAAALRILERERGGVRPTARADAERTAHPSVAARPGEDAFTRVFFSVGERDGVRAGDLVGAITGETGITSDRIGKLDIRESHTVAEIAAAVAPVVVEKMNGVSIKGRSVTARVDDRPASRARDARRERGDETERPPRRDGGRAGARGGFGERPREKGRGGFGERPREKGRGAFGERPREGGRGGFGERGREREAARGGRFSREGGPARGPRRDRDRGADRRPPRDTDERPRGGARWDDRSSEGRVPRAAREREEWSERADRVRHARRRRPDET